MNKLTFFNTDLQAYLHDIEDLANLLIDECESDERLIAKNIYQIRIETILNNTIKQLHKLHDEYEDNREDYECDDEPAELNLQQLLR